MTDGDRRASDRFGRVRLHDVRHGCATLHVDAPGCEGGGVRPVQHHLLMLIATTGRGHKVKRPSKPAIGTMLANLQCNNPHLILERVDEEQPDGDWYVQVRQTVSQEKVLGALLGWAAAKPGWSDGFMWNNIGAWFEHPPAEKHG